MTIRLYLVDDHRAFRHYLWRLLAREPDLQLVGQAGDAAQALQDARRAAPAPLADVVLLDIVLRGRSGIELAGDLNALNPGAQLLGLSTHDDPALTQALLTAGACACLCKQEPIAKLLQAIRGAVAR